VREKRDSDVPSAFLWDLLTAVLKGGPSERKLSNSCEYHDHRPLTDTSLNCSFTIEHLNSGVNDPDTGRSTHAKENPLKRELAATDFGVEAENTENVEVADKNEKVGKKKKNNNAMSDSA
jgi:hypothetical protein